jgi:hypothetical protein
MPGLAPGRVIPAARIVAWIEVPEVGLSRSQA